MAQRAELPMETVALAQAEAGNHVFPVWPGQKRPATKRGLRDATTDARRIRRWWAANPSFNVAIATAPSWLVVIDCDRGRPLIDGTGQTKDWPLGGEPPAGVTGGDDVLVDVAGDLGESVDWLFDGTVPVTRTPSGGLHLFFRPPASGRTIRSGVNVLPWVDVRARGGYVIGPWSWLEPGHEWVSGWYRPEPSWEHEIHVDVDASFRPTTGPTLRLTFNPPALPEWLADLLVARTSATSATTPTSDGGGGVLDRVRRDLDREHVGGSYAATALADESARVRGAVNGTRNHTLNGAAFTLGTLVGAGLLDKTTVTDELSVAARAAGLDDVEITRTIRSGLTAGIASPREVVLHGMS